jgi:hypothetical protein
MAVTPSWVLYNSVSPFEKTFDNVPYMPLNLTDYLQVFGVKFHGSEIDYLDLFLQDKYAEIYYSDAANEYRANLISNADIEIYVAKFWTYNVDLKTVEDVGTDFTGVTYYNGSANDGIGATLTSASNGIFTHDGANNFSVGDKILVKEQSNSFENGIYEITILGNASTPWVLTRVTEANTDLKIKDVIVCDGTSTAWQIDQTSPAIDGASAITFTTSIASVSDLNTNLTWTNILAVDGGGDMVRFTVNSSTENRSLDLDKRFESYSYKIAIKLVRTDGTFDHFQIRNLKLLTQFKTKLPNTTPRPVKIFSEPGLAVVRDSMQVEYYQATTTADNVTYLVTGKTWGSSDKIEVYRQPLSGVRSVVSPTEFLVSGTSGRITFLSAQIPTSIITVTIARPLTEQGI